MQATSRTTRQLPTPLSPVLTRELSQARNGPDAFRTFTPSGKSLLVCSSSYHGGSELIELDVATGRELAAVSMPVAELYDLKFSADALLLACGGTDSSTIDPLPLLTVLRRSPTGALEVLYTLPAERCLAFNPSLLANMMLTASDADSGVGSLRVAETGELVRKVSLEDDGFSPPRNPDDGPLTTYALMPDCSRLLVSRSRGWQRSVKLWDTVTSTVLCAFEREDQSESCFSFDGRIAFVPGRDAMAVCDATTGSDASSMRRDGKDSFWTRIVRSSPVGGLVFSVDWEETGSYRSDPGPGMRKQLRAPTVIFGQKLHLRRADTGAKMG